MIFNPFCTVCRLIGIVHVKWCCFVFHAEQLGDDLVWHRMINASQSNSCLVWTVSLYAAETVTLMKADVWWLEAFEMWIWQRMETISWVYIISNEVLTEVEEDRQIMKIIQQRQRHWIGHILRHESLLLDIIGQMKGRHTRGRRRLQVLPHVGKR